MRIERMIRLQACMVDLRAVRRFREQPTPRFELQAIARNDCPRSSDITVRA
jgi:hypothetical protein